MTALRRLAGWLVDHRSALPGWVNRLMESAVRTPDGWVGRIAARALGGTPPPPTAPPARPVRVYIGPTNYSGQGYRWARALEAADARIGARNLAQALPGGFDFPADTLVPVTVAASSRPWADAEWEAVRGFTHVLVEAERPLFGPRFARSLPAEVAALREAGISVAFLAHGTDVRDPDAHAARTRWSPYPEDPRTETLRRDVRENLALLAAAAAPVFVSTPDLLADLPSARWCPVVVDAARFATDAPLLPEPTARVLHVSSAPVQKGSHLIEPALAPLIGAGSVEYRLVTGTASAQMPAVYAAADIVIDQFRLGSYGVAACEAMAAGRVVIGHVLPEVRARVKADSGFELPILEATPETLGDVVARLREDPLGARRLGEQGRAFVAAVHSGSASARALIDGWIGPLPE